ncbi:MAG: sialidase family protein [Chromatiales bacterium]|nr:sialidase family protein [Chromatiales bacterium]
MTFPLIDLRGRLAVLLLVFAGLVFASGPVAADWQPPAEVLSEIVGGGADVASHPQVAFDAAGNAIAVWEQVLGGARYIVASRWDGSTWSAPQPISEFPGDAYYPRLAVNAAGNAVAVWQQVDGLGQRIVAAVWDGVWGSPQNISDPLDDGFYRPRVAFDGSGNAIAIWWQELAGEPHVVANHWDGAWNGATVVSAPSLFPPLFPEIAMDGSGHAIVAWIHHSPTAEIHASHWDGSTWSASLRINDGMGNLFQPQVAFDASGAGIVVWGQDYFSGGALVRASRWDGNAWDAGAWSAPVSVSDNDSASDGASEIALAMDGSGRAMALWIQTPNLSVNGVVHASHWDGGAWSMPQRLDDGTFAQFPQVAYDASGTAIAIWHHDNMPWPIGTSRWDGNSWDVPVTINTPGSGRNPQIAMDGAGNAVAVWEQFDTPNRIVALFYRNLSAAHVPTLSTWALMLLAMLLAIVAMRRGVTGSWRIG